MEKIELETIFTPWTLDTYQTFTFEGAESMICESEGVEYDDMDWDYDCKGYINDLAKNLVTLLNDNILDDVILSVTSDLKVYSPKEYNFSTDKIFLEFLVDEKKLDNYIETNKESFEAEKLRDRDGFMWFGDELQTKLNFYLYSESVKKYTAESYYYDQMDSVPEYEYITATPIKK